MRPDMSAPLALSSGQTHQYSEEDEARLLEMIGNCNVSELYSFVILSDLKDSVLKNCKEGPKAPKKKKAKSLYDRIERACMSINACHAAVMTSTKKPTLPAWTKAPGTPVSEAWETTSGPVLRNTPLATPIRKIVLKLNPNNQSSTPTTIRLPQAGTPKCPVQVKAPTERGLDIEQKLARFENSLASHADQNVLVSCLSDMMLEFAQDSVAVKEWVCNQTSKHLASEIPVTVKSGIIGLIFTHYSAVIDWTGYSKSISTSVEFLCKNLAACTQQLGVVCSVIDKLAIDDSVLLRLCGLLLELIPSCSNTPAISSLLGTIASCNHECREFLLNDILSMKSAEDIWDASLLGCIIQTKLLKGGFHITELTVKNELGPITENLYGQISKSGAVGVNVLARLVKGLAMAIDSPECLSAVVMAKYMGQFAVMVLFSAELSNVDNSARQVICDALTSFTQSLRAKERQAIPGEVSLEYFYNLSLSLKERSEIASSYSTLMGLEDSREATALPVTSAHGRLSAKYLSPLIQSLVLAHLRLASDPNHQIRVKAMRGLVSLLNDGDDFIRSEGFDNFIASKIEDASVTIRDLSLELLSKCFTMDQIVQLGLVDLIKTRLFDSSTLVRKRAVRFYRDLLPSELGADLLAEIVSGLLRCADDDDSSISQLAKKTLKDGWIIKMTASMHERQSAVQFVALIIKVIRLLGAESGKLQLFFNTCAEDPALCEGVSQLATLTVDILFESLIESVESSGWETVRFILNAIDIFVGDKHGYLTSHIRLLYELTKSNEMAIVEFSLKLMRIAVVGADRSALMQLTGCQQHLAMLILKGSEPVVRNAVDLLYCYSDRVEETSGTLGALWDRFFNFLKSNCKTAVTPSFVSAVCRGLFSLSCLAKCNLVASDGDNTPLTSAIDLFVKYFQCPNTTVSYYALQAIASLFPDCPRLAFEGTISAAFFKALESERMDLALVVLRAFINLIGKQPASSPQVSFESSMAHSEVSLTASILQKYIGSMKNIALRPNKECQLLSLKVLSFALFNGLCHPHQVLPTIVALSTSPIPEVLLRARDIVRSAAETHSSFLFSDYTGILRTMFDLHSQFDEYHGYYDDGFGSESLLSTLYSEVRLKRAKRNDFLAIALQEFGEACKNENDDYAIFIVETMSTLPIKTSEEVAYLLAKVHDMAMVISGSIVDECENPVPADITKGMLLLKFRGYLAETFSFSLEKGEKSLANDAQGKCAATRRNSEPLILDELKPLSTAERIVMTRRLLEEQHWIETGTTVKMPLDKPCDRPKAQKIKRKRRKRLTVSEDSEDDADVF